MLIDRNKYLVVKTAIENDLEALNQLAGELSQLGLYPDITASRIGGFEKDSSFACRLVGTYLSDYYEGIENIAKRIAKEIDGHISTGDEWHKELIDQVSRELPGKRPSVFSEQTYELLDELRRFRHVFQAKYGFRLNPGKIYRNVSKLKELHQLMEIDINSFLHKMEALVSIDDLNDSSDKVN